MQCIVQHVFVTLCFSSHEPRSKRVRETSPNAGSNPGSRISRSSCQSPSPSSKSRPKKRISSKMESIIEEMQADYRADGKKIEKMEKEIEEKKEINSFYTMMGDKMSKFPPQDQVWMEDQIWNLYMNLAHKSSTTTPKNTTSMTYPPQLNTIVSAAPQQTPLSQIQHNTMSTVDHVGLPASITPPQSQTTSMNRSQFDQERNSFSSLTSYMQESIHFA